MSSSSGESSSPKMYVLKSSEGEAFEVEEAVAFQSGMMKNMIQDGCFDPAIPLPNVTSKVLVKIIEYCKRHAAPQVAAEDLKKFDADLAKSDSKTLFELVLAANYLDMRNLLDLTAQAIAESIKDKTPEEVRMIFNIENDFTAEEEAAIRKENEWAFEGLNDA